MNKIKDIVENFPNLALSKEDQEKLIRSNDAELIGKYSQHHPFYKGNEITLVEVADEETISKYVERYMLLDEDAQVALCRKASDDLMKRYIEKYRVCKAAQLELLKRGLLLHYIAKHSLYASVQEEMVEEGDMDLIKAYIAHDKFDEGVLQSLVVNRNLELLRIYTKKHDLPDAIKVAVFNSGDVELFESCTGK